MSKPVAPKRRKILGAAIESLESRLLLTRLVGIDVSEHNNSINWTSVKNAGKNFAYIRATYGMTSDDATFPTNAANAVAAGLKVGYYHYAYYDLAGHTPTNEADNFWNAVYTDYGTHFISNNGNYLQPVLDVEQNGAPSNGMSITDWANAWCDRVTARAAAVGIDIHPLVYLNTNFATNVVTGALAQGRPLWLANWPGGSPDVQTEQPGSFASSANGVWQNGTSPTNYQSWAFWQYADNGTVSGISGAVDLDVLQGDWSVLQNFTVGSTGRFADGTRVKTPYSINIWDTGNANGTVLGTTTAGQLGTIIEGPIYGNSFLRWHVDFDTGTDGWVAEYQSLNDTSPFAPLEWLTGPVVTNISSTAANGSYKAGSLIPITVTFSDTATVTGTPRIVLDVGGTNVNANYASGSGTNTLIFNYTVAAGQTDSDLDYATNDSLIFNNGTIKDSLGNFYTLTLPSPGAAGSLGANKNIVIDTTAPTITGVTSTLANGSYTVGTVVPIRVTFSENVNVTGTPTLALNSGGSASYASGSGTNTLTFNYTIGAGQNSADLDYTSTSALALSGGTIQDAATNNATLTLPAPGATNSLGANKNIVVDTNAPVITNVTSSTANGAYKAGTIIPITVAFNENVFVTGTPQLTLNNGAVVNYSGGSGTSTLTFSYTVAGGQDVADLDYASTTALALNGGTIRDLATNNATLTLAAPGAQGSLGFNKNIVIDTTAPTISNITSTAADGPYGPGATISITVAFSENVNVTGTPLLALANGGTASYASGSGTSTLTFSYTVTSGQDTGDLDYASNSALSLNGGTIRDPAANDATLTLPNPGDPGSLGANKNIVIDTVSPVITNVTSSSADGLYGVGALISITVTFSEAVNVTGTPLLSLNDGASASYASGSGTATLSFDYTVAAGQAAADLDYASAAALALNGGTIRDAATNSANLALSTPGAAGSLGDNKNIAVDGVPPTATFGGETPTRGDANLDFTIDYADAPAGVDTLTFDGNDVTVTGPNGYNVSASLVSISGTIATYRIAAPGGAWNVADNGLYTVTQTAGEVKDLANNARPAGTIGTFNANLPFAYVQGTTLHVEYAPGVGTVRMSSDESSQFIVAENDVPLSFAPGAFSDVVVHGTSSDDAIVIATTLSQPLTFDGQTGADAITIDAGGSHTFAADAAAMSASLSMTINAGGSATFSANQHLASLTVNGTAALIGGPGKVIVTQSIAATGSLDLNDNNLVVDYTGTSPLGSWDGSAYTGVEGLIASGANGGSWDGPGIRTSLGSTRYNLGVDEASAVLGPTGGSFFGESVDATAVLVKFTYGGDANLDGKLNIDDYTRIDTGFAGGATGWINGDFNRDGKINIDDYVMIDSNFVSQGPPL